MTIYLLITLLAIATGYIAGNLTGWLITRKVVQGPFNWRIFLGPWVYLNRYYR